MRIDLHYIQSESKYFMLIVHSVYEVYGRENLSGHAKDKTI